MAAKEEKQIKSATAGLFSGMRPLSNPEEAPPKRSEPEKRKGKAKQAEPIKTKVDPVPIWPRNPETVARWKAYATATGISVSELAREAMEEYIDRHKLTGKQKTIYDALID